MTAGPGIHRPQGTGTPSTTISMGIVGVRPTVVNYETDVVP